MGKPRSKIPIAKTCGEKRGLSILVELHNGQIFLEVVFTGIEEAFIGSS